MSSARVVLAMIGSLLVGACGHAQRAADITAAIESRVASGMPLTGDPVIDDAARRYYGATGHAPAWIADGNRSRAQGVLAWLDTAPSHGMGPRDERLGLQSDVGLLEGQRQPDAARVAELDVHLTLAVMRMGRDLAIGATSPSALDSRWKARRALPDLAGALVAAEGDLQAWTTSVQPQHREYAQLHQAMAETAMATSLTEDERRQRLRVLALNLERWRWMPDDLGARHLLVNVPAYDLRAREGGRDVLRMRVVVGKRGGNETPIFSGEMQTVVFSPAWNVPDRIAREETLPAVMKDASYLSRQQIDVFRRTRTGLTRVDPDDVDWNDGEDLQGLTFRQRPGAGNALGSVKFLFPNAYDVYLHDTPNDQAFARRSRALSHGCVRLSEPAALARYVLRDQAEWDDASIAEAMEAGRERHVKLPSTLPVHIGYFTAWPDDAGGVAFFEDVYGYDAGQAGLPGREATGSK